MSLSKKMLRDIKINKTQFIAIFLMAFLGIFAYCGIYGDKIRTVIENVQQGQGKDRHHRF